MAEFCATCLRRRAVDGACSCAPSVTAPRQEPVGPQPIPPPAFDSGLRTTSRALVLSAVAVLVVGTAVTAAVLAANLGSPAAVPFDSNAIGGATTSLSTLSTVGDSPLAVSGVTAVAGITATCTSGPGADSAGNPFTYEASNAIDQRRDTAWRCDHDGVGARLVLTLAEHAEIAWVGMVPGFAKTDPYDGTDRYAQGRRVSQARFIFDDGTYVDHVFDTSPVTREPQVVRFPPVATGHVEVLVLASVPGSPTNGFGPTDKIAIAELAVGR
jgi:hypothetical protein